MTLKKIHCSLSWSTRTLLCFSVYFEWQPEKINLVKKACVCLKQNSLKFHTFSKTRNLSSMTSKIWLARLNFAKLKSNLTSVFSIWQKILCSVDTKQNPLTKPHTFHFDAENHVSLNETSLKSPFPFEHAVNYCRFVSQKIRVLSKWRSWAGECSPNLSFFYPDASTFKILRYFLNFDPLSLFLEITRNTFAKIWQDFQRIAK